MSGNLPGDFLFLDESGDLGLGSASTRFFAVGILHLRSEFALQRCAKRVRRKLLGRGSPKGEMKWSGSRPEVRMAMMDEICGESSLVAGISAAVLDKRWINAMHAARKPDVRYNFAARIAMEKGGLFEKEKAKRLVVTIDQRNPRATDSMREHLELLALDGALCCDVTVRGKDSEQCPQLQAADFAVGAIYTAYSRGEWKYLNRLKAAGIEVVLRVLRRGN